MRSGWLVLSLVALGWLNFAGCGEMPAPAPAAEASAAGTPPAVPAPAPTALAGDPTQAAAADPAAKTVDPALVGIWNFDACNEQGEVANSRPGGGGVPARLMGFKPEVLKGVDQELANFSIVRADQTQQVKVAKTGWATFSAIPDNGLNEGVHTPIGDHALALFADQDGNWIHFPGLCTAMVEHPGGATRSFGIALWVLVQSEWKKDHAEFPTMNPLFRFAQTDGRFFLMPAKTDRLYTEDVGNGLGGGYGYQIPWARRDAATSRWVHLVFTADGRANKFQIWVNGEKVNYREDKATERPWPAGGGMQLNYKPGETTDGAVMGRWPGGAGAPGRTIGIAAVVVVNGEPISQARAQHLYELGKQGKKFDGKWPMENPGK